MFPTKPLKAVSKNLLYLDLCPTRPAPTIEHPKVQLVGILIALVLVAAVVIPFVLIRSSSNSASASFYDGQRSASLVSVPEDADRSAIKEACRSFFSQGLPGDDVGDQEAPFVNGCIQAIDTKQTKR